MGNIFVSPTDHTQIVSLIDWQSTSISPLFSQVRWPVFLEPPKNYPKGPQIPKLPENFEELNADEKAYAISEKDEATLSKAYEIATYRNNREAYSAKWELATPLRELYVRLGVTWEEGIVSLRSRMIQIFENWEYMALPDPCPLHFTPAEIASHKRQHAEYTEWCEIQDIAQQCLGADADGWISPEADLAITKSENEKVLGMLIHRIASEKSEQEVRTFWPFPP
ncbi:MAG: hypothetical protein M1817_006648 [Caeruleum heppii]|nr:MAG: hypothetical protein M1817_006648 [Caeruleum heppii]